MELFSFMPLSDGDATLTVFALGGLISLASVYNSLRLALNTQAVKQEANEQEIARLRDEVKEIKGELKDSINDIKEMLHSIAIDIEKIRPDK